MFSQSIIYHCIDDILLADSDTNNLEKQCEEPKKLPCLWLQIVSEKIKEEILLITRM